jgi:hypothetical protein
MSKFFAARKFTLTAAMAILIGIPTVGWTGDQVPLNATFATNFSLVPTTTPPDGCHFSVPVTGVGQVSHLGNATTTIQQLVNFCQFQQVGTMTVQGANGDTLTATFTGTSSTIDAQGFLNVDGDIVFTGGSGRFQGASGNAVFHVFANLSTFPLQGVFTFTGSISSPGSLKQ